jgi:hypothetical protein
VIELGADAFVAHMQKLASTLPDAVSDAMSDTAAVGFAALMADSSFNNRTFALRNAFSQAGDGDERRLFIDKSASPRKGKTPPWMYGAYLNDGAELRNGGVISPRRFMESAAQAIEAQTGGLADGALARWMA